MDAESDVVAGIAQLGIRAEISRATAPPVAGVTQRIILTTPAGADGHHESVGFDDIAVWHLNLHRARYQHRALGNDAYASAGHGLSARITTRFSSRDPRRSRPVSSNHRVREVNTGPKGTHWEAITLAFRPVNRKRSRERWMSAKAD